MGYSLGQAAKVAGRSKTTIHRAFKSGKLSASRCEDGGWSIDPAELSRAYPGTANGAVPMERSVTAARHDVELEQLRGERDRYRALAEERDETIRDLRARLDTEVEERRRLTLLLSPPAPQVSGVTSRVAGQARPGCGDRAGAAGAADLDLTHGGGGGFSEGDLIFW